MCNLASSQQEGGVYGKGQPLTGRLSASVPCETNSFLKRSPAQPPPNAIRGANFLGWFPPYFTHPCWVVTKALSSGNHSLTHKCGKNVA